MRRLIICTFLTTVLGAATVCPAVAQSIDYGAFEELFGEPVTTSATGTPQRASLVPTDMEIVTADMIRRSGATDIPDVLAHVVGVDVLRWGITSADVAIRGYDTPFSPRLLVLVNGRQVYLDDWGRTEWDAIPVQLAEIRQIEVVKGPNTALFGFNAAAGVINIVTYNPLYDTVNTASVTAGTQAFVQGSVVGTGRIGQDAAIRLSAGATRANEFTSLRDLAPQLGFRQQSFRGAVSADALVRISADQEFELEATHSALSHMEAIAVWAPAAAVYDLSSVKARYSANTGIGQIQATVYTNFNHEVGNLGGIVFGLSRVTFNNERTDVQLQDEFKLGADHTFRVSAEYLHTAVNTSPIEGATVGYDVGSASAMWQWQIVPELSLTTAARVDNLWLHRSGSFSPAIPFSNSLWQRQITEPSFNVGLVYQPRDIDVLRLTAARGVQLPSLFALGAVQFSNPFLVDTGNPAINPTVVTNYELDWDHKLPDLNANTRVAVFYQTNDSLQTLSSAVLFPLPTGVLLSTSGNVGSSDEVGIELSAKGELPGGWHWNLGYSPRLVRDHFLPDQPSLATGVDFEHTTPRHVIDLGAGWAQGNWEIDGAARFESTFDGLLITPAATYTSVRVNSYVMVDARVAYRIMPHMTVSLIGSGFTAAHQRQTSIGTVDRRVLGMLQATF